MTEHVPDKDIDHCPWCGSEPSHTAGRDHRTYYECKSWVRKSGKRKEQSDGCRIGVLEAEGDER